MLYSHLPLCTVFSESVFNHKISFQNSLFIYLYMLHKTEQSQHMYMVKHFSESSTFRRLHLLPPLPLHHTPLLPQQWHPGTAGTQTPGRSCWTQPVVTTGRAVKRSMVETLTKPTTQRLSFLCVIVTHVHFLELA